MSEEPTESRPQEQRIAGTAGRGTGWLWPSLAVLATLVALRGLFTTSSIFYVRDLCLAFWPTHLWYRHAIFDGEFPLWDPFRACGQSAIADPVRMILFPPVALLRLLLPEVLGFNLSVALPVPVAALGTYAFLRRRASPGAACIGALAFALSGPVLSSTSSPNLSWSVALLPWVLWGTDRLSERLSAGRFATAAAVVALQALAGEPLSLAFTCVLALAFAALVGGERGARRAFATLGAMLGACACGALLAAAQLLPLADATSRSPRSLGAVALGVEQWTLHPYTLVELFAPMLFGDYFVPGGGPSYWLSAFNDGRYPLIFSIYVGAGVLPLAVCGILVAFGAFAHERRAWAIFWSATIVVSILCALGSHTPVYPAIRAAMPFLDGFRFPVKYLYATVFAVAVLAADGWESLAAPVGAGRRTRLTPAGALFAAGATLVGVVATLFVLTAPGTVSSIAASLARSAGVQLVEPAAASLVSAIGSAAPRFAVISFAACLLIWLAGSSHAMAKRAHALLIALVATDLLSVGSNLNPTLDVSLFREPSWVATTRARPEARVYVARKELDPDVPEKPVAAGAFESLSVVTISALLGWQDALFTSQWGVREAVSSDLTLLWPKEYTLATSDFAEADRAARARFLARTGTGYFLVPYAPESGAHEVLRPVDLPNAVLYEADAPVARVVVAPLAGVEPDLRTQAQALLAAGFDPARLVLLEAPPPDPSGAPGSAAPPSARIVRDLPNEVEIAATAGDAGGYVVLADSYSPHWTAEVDGAPAPVLRANGIFRAVRVAPGAHTVRFAYRPTPFYAGLGISLSTALALVAFSLAKRAVRAAA
jgi:hypothetical protein